MRVTDSHSEGQLLKFQNPDFNDFDVQVDLEVEKAMLLFYLNKAFVCCNNLLKFGNCPVAFSPEGST